MLTSTPLGTCYTWVVRWASCVSGPAKFQPPMKMSALQLAPCSPPFSDLLLRGKEHIAIRVLIPRPNSRRTEGLSPSPSLPGPYSPLLGLDFQQVPGVRDSSSLPCASLSPCPAQPSALTLNHSHCPSGMSSVFAGLCPYIPQGKFLQG